MNRVLSALLTKPPWPVSEMLGNSAARAFHIGIGGQELRLGVADIRALQQQVGRQAGRNALRRDRRQASAAHPQARRRLTETSASVAMFWRNC